MKKIYTLLACVLLAANVSKAQDTLLFEDFELNNFWSFHLDSVDLLPANFTDTMWYSADLDALTPAPNGIQWQGFFPLKALSVVDQYETIYGTTVPDTNTVIGANSWTEAGDGPAGLENNWLVTPSLVLGAHDTLFWKSAPRQTPRYLDGYEVRLSTTTNEDIAFTHLLFTAGEMIGAPIDGDTTFANYTFSPTGSNVFLHGEDETYIDIASVGTKASHIGQLRPFSVALDSFANQTVFIGFHHNTHDDVLITFDDIMVRGEHTTITGINENKSNFSINVFPNPAGDNAQLSFELTSETSVAITVYDVAGKAVYSENEGTLSRGRHFAQINTAALAKGFYTVTVQTSTGRSTAKLMVK